MGHETFRRDISQLTGRGLCCAQTLMRCNRPAPLPWIHSFEVLDLSMEFDLHRRSKEDGSNNARPRPEPNRLLSSHDAQHTCQTLHVAMMSYCVRRNRHQLPIPNTWGRLWLAELTHANARSRPHLLDLPPQYVEHLPCALWMTYVLHELLPLRSRSDTTEAPYGPSTQSRRHSVIDPRRPRLWPMLGAQSLQTSIASTAAVASSGTCTQRLLSKHNNMEAL